MNDGKETEIERNICRSWIMRQCIEWNSGIDRHTHTNTNGSTYSLFEISIATVNWFWCDGNNVCLPFWPLFNKECSIFNVLCDGMPWHLFHSSNFCSNLAFILSIEPDGTWQTKSRQQKCRQGISSVVIIT